MLTILIVFTPIPVEASKTNSPQVSTDLYLARMPQIAARRVIRVNATAVRLGLILVLMDQQRKNGAEEGDWRDVKWRCMLL